MKNSELGVKIAQYDVDKALADYKPTLTAGGSLNSNYISGLDPIEAIRYE